VKLVLNVDSAVDPRRLVDDIERALRAKHLVLPRRALTIGNVWFAPMASYVEGMGIGVKLVGIYPSASPPVKALAALIDPNTGEVLALADATKLTGWRTAAASALALRLIGVRPKVIGVVGAGVQAQYHIRVFREVFAPESIMLYSRSRAKEVAGMLGVKYAGLDEVLSADVVIAATNSAEPVVKGAKLGRGSAVISVGAPRPVRELDEDVKRRAGCALVDSPEAVEETDDVAGVEAVPLEDLLAGRRSCAFKEIALYKSVGYAPFDTAAVYHLYTRAEGVEVELS
jgi:alanine dehydrogenase